MQKFVLAFAMAGAAGLRLFNPGVSSPAPSAAGAFQIDSRHSDAQIISGATTDYGKKKIDVTLGFGRVNGELRLA